MPPFLQRLGLLCAAAVLAAAPLQAAASNCTGTNASSQYIQGLTLDGPALGDWTPSAMHWDSGLVWQRCVQGMAFNPDSGHCEGTAGVFKWYEWAAQAPGLLPLSFQGQDNWSIPLGFSSNRLLSGDWRLPYKNELLALHSACTGSPAINAQVFPDTPTASFATASPDSAPAAWRVETSASPVAHPTSVTFALSARLVRGGQPFAALPASSYAANGNTGQVTAFAPFTLEPLSGGTAAESMAWGGVRISGAGNPQLRVNAWGSWVTEAIVRSGDEVSVRLSAPATSGATASATLVLRSGQTTGTAAGASNGGDEATVLQEITTTFSATSVGAPAPQVCAREYVLRAAPDGASGGGAGSSWSTPASLQHALALANADTDLATCYQIHLKQGLYKPGPAGNAAAYFAIDRPLQLLGGYTGNPADPTERQLQAGNTVLSGDIDSNDSANAQGITEVARLPINGAPGNQINGTNSQRVLVIGGLDEDQGNGWFTAQADQASYTLLEGLTLTGAMNDSGAGGGLLCNGAGAGRQCSPLLRQLRVSGNRASLGGGLYNNGQKGGTSSPQIDGVTFSGNGANFGGAMGNAAAQSGTSSPDIINSTFSGNQAGSASFGGGGAIDTDTYSGGTGQPRIRHSTFSGNQASDGSALQGGKPEVFASIFWDNPGTLFSGLKKASSVTYSTVQGGRAGAGNLDTDPLLGPLQDNGGATPTHLPGAGSPAIDALADCNASPGTDQRSIARPQGFGCDIGAVEAPASSYTAPSAPTSVSATPGNGAALVQWSASASSGSSAPTGYTVTALPGGHTCTAASGANSCTVTGLDNGTQYTFTVTASNGAGASAASIASGAVTPAAPVTISITSTAPAAGLVTAVFGSDTTTAATGYLTVLQGSGAQCGTAVHIQAGQDATGVPAYRRGALALLPGTPAPYTVRNLAHAANYTLCATAGTGGAVASADFSTPAVAAYASPEWQAVGGAGFSAELANEPSLAFAPDGTPYLAYIDYFNGLSGKARVVRWKDGTWQAVGSAGVSAGAAQTPSLAFAPDGTLYVAYADGANVDKATVMRWDGSAWQAVGSAGASAGAVQNPSLAFAPDGTPYVAYTDLANGNKATVMRWSGSTWQAVGSAGASAGAVQNPALAFAPDGTPYLAYTDVLSGYPDKARVVRWDGSAWQTLGSSGASAGIALGPSLALAPDGTPYVAYRDNANGNKATVVRLVDLPPTLTAASPASGPSAGGTKVTLSGSHLLGASAVQFGGTAATAFLVDSAGQITATAPAHAAGAVDITVTTAVASVVLAGGYTYVAPTVYAITATAQPSAGGSVACTPASAGQGASATCTATAHGGYAFQEWTGACAGQAAACSLTNVTAPQTSVALFQQEHAGLALAEGGQQGQALRLALLGSANAWAIQTASTATLASTGVAAPSGVRFPYGLVALELHAGTVGSSATVVLTYPQVLPAGTKYYKFGKTAANTTPHWYEFSAAVISGNTVTLTLTDGGEGDNDLTANSEIDDPGGPAVLVAPPPPPPPPPEPPSPVQLQISTSGAGTVQRSVAGSVVGTPGSTTTVQYPYAQAVTLTAQAQTGARFTGWSGACSGLLACNLTLYSNQSVQASFTSPPPAVTCRARAFSANEERLLDAYLAYYGRPADVAGLAYWRALADARGDVGFTIDAFSQSIEFQRRFGQMDGTQLIANLYQQMYGRQPDPAGASYYGAQLASGQSSLVSIAIHIFDGRLGRDRLVVDNRRKVARHFVTRFEELGSAAPTLNDAYVMARLVSAVDTEAASAEAGCALVDELLDKPAPK